MRVSMLLAGGIATALSGLASAQGVAAPTTGRIVDGFLSHRATYDLQLKSAGWSANLSSLNGRLVSEFDDVCEGFTFNQRLVTSYTDAQGKATSTNFWISTYETADGGAFRFTLNSEIVGTSAEKTQGVATRDGAGAVKVDLSKPNRKKISLPTGVIFPTEFSGRIVASAKAGKKSVSGQMFEGDASGQVFEAFVAIGAPKEATEAELSVPGGEALRGLTAWPVSVSYYQAGAEADLPDYETSFTLFENGITSNVTLDYGTYALSGQLRAIEGLGRPDC